MREVDCLSAPDIVSIDASPFTNSLLIVDRDGMTLRTDESTTVLTMQSPSSALFAGDVVVWTYEADIEALDELPSAEVRVLRDRGNLVLSTDRFLLPTQLVGDSQAVAVCVQGECEWAATNGHDHGSMTTDSGLGAALSGRTIAWVSREKAQHRAVDGPESYSEFDDVLHFAPLRGDRLTVAMNSRVAALVGAGDDGFGVLLQGDDEGVTVARIGLAGDLQWERALGSTMKAPDLVAFQEGVAVFEGRDATWIGRDGAVLANIRASIEIRDVALGHGRMFVATATGIQAFAPDGASDCSLLPSGGDSSGD